MKWISLTPFYLIVGLLASCTSEGTQKQYVVNGEVSGLSNNTKIQIKIKDSILNSATVMDGKFQLTGSTDEPAYVSMIVKGTANSKSFWLSNDTINILGSSSNLRSVKISGSPLQDILENRKESRDSIKKEFLKTNTSINMRYMELVYQQDQNFVKAHPNSPISLRTLDMFKTAWDLEIVKKFYDSMSKESRATKHGRAIANFVNLFQELEVGDTFVNFDMKDTNGVSIELKNVLDKYTLLEFWSSWCGPCRESNPSLVKLYDEYQSKGLEIVGVSLDESRTNWKEAIQEDKLEWIHLSDLKGADNHAGLIYGVSGIPDNFVINQEGRIIARGVSAQELRKLIEESTIP
jgi:thiol-disulfide isomerase/thioredoxin